ELVPSQTSSASQLFVDARHTVPAGASASAGQLLLGPSQLSAASHTPVAARQTAMLFASAGQVALMPEQFSATSHTPAEGRHGMLDGWKVSAGQGGAVPGDGAGAGPE